MSGEKVFVHVTFFVVLLLMVKLFGDCIGVVEQSNGTELCYGKVGNCYLPS